MKETDKTGVSSDTEQPRDSRILEVKDFKEEECNQFYQMVLIDEARQRPKKDHWIEQNESH